MASSTAAPATGRVTGTYLTFQVGAEEYGIEIFKVREIIGMLPITPVPGSPPEMIGVINLRGKVIPVVSVRTRFGMPAVAAHPHNVIIVVENRKGEIGLAVDRVAEVARFTEAETVAPPSYGLAVDTTCVSAIGKSQGRIRILLDIARVLGDTAESSGNPA
ncbi:MAG TPA: chemotaxis protein CheW [Planctomycetota bacterium]|nr:chemotaxis protein CheW [Planctomycetota bacterium]